MWISKAILNCIDTWGCSLVRDVAGSRTKRSAALLPGASWLASILSRQGQRQCLSDLLSRSTSTQQNRSACEGNGAVASTRHCRRAIRHTAADRTHCAQHCVRTLGPRYRVPYTYTVYCSGVRADRGAGGRGPLRAGGFCATRFPYTVST